MKVVETVKVKDSIDEDGTAWLTDYDNETSDLKEPELAASEGLKEEYLIINIHFTIEVQSDSCCDFRWCWC